MAVRLSIDGAIIFDLPAQDRAAPRGAPAGRGRRRSTGAAGRRTRAVPAGGFCLRASVTRATTAGQSLVVNGRPVTDPALRTALRVAYRDVIANGRYPVAALWLACRRTSWT